MGSGAGGGMSEGVLTEMRSRLIAGLKRYFHGKRMEGLLSVQVRRMGRISPWLKSSRAVCWAGC